MPIQQRKVSRQPRRRNVKAGGSLSFQNRMFKVEAKANYALSQLNTEMKEKDISFTASGAGGGSVLLLNGLQQGTSNTNRIGETVRWKNISMRVAYGGHASENIWYRYLIVRDRQPNGTAATVGTILNAASVQAHRNLNFSKRFKVLADRTLYLPLGDGSVDGGFTSLFIDLEKVRKAQPAKNKSANETNYGLGNAGTIADITENAYYLVQVSSATTNNPTFSGDIRMRYLDN